jgi:hypothetical protein
MREYQYVCLGDVNCVRVEKAEAQAGAREEVEERSRILITTLHTSLMYHPTHSLRALRHGPRPANALLCLP